MKRLLVLGLDGGTLDLIRPWTEQGRLPAFASMLDEGTCSPLRSVPNINTAPAWTTFMTGKNPGKHGIFWFAEQGDQPGTVRFVTAADRRAPSLWRLLSAEGHRVGVVNVPLTYPAEHVNGILVAGFDAPSITSTRFCYPPDLMKEIKKNTGDYRLHAAVDAHGKAGRRDRVVREALRAEESRVRAALHLMTSTSWDVFMYMIKATDQAAHYLWDYGAESQESLFPIYEYADQTLRRLRAAAGPDCGVIVMSDHGMGWRQPASEYLNDILEQLGFLRRKTPVGRQSTWHAFRLAKRLGPRAKGLVKQALPGPYKRFGYRVRFGDIDWSSTRAYCDNTRSCVWVNLRGRDPQGIVNPGDHKQLVEDLRAVMLDLIDPDTGERVVEAAWVPEEIYSGPYTDLAPDLQIEWLYHHPVKGLEYDGRFGRARATRPAKGTMNSLTGAHRPMGALMVHGPQFKRTEELGDPKLEDLAPTILHLADMPVPDDMDGRVLTEVLAEPYASKSVSFSAVDEGEDGERIGVAAYTEAEAAEVEERLRALGYL